MTENPSTSDVPYGLGDVDVPEGHQATLRPVEGSDVPQVSVEPVPDDPKPDMAEPTTKAGLDAHEAEQAQVAQAFAAEHERQLQAARDDVIAAAGESGNIGTDGKPHFAVMREREKLNDSEPDHDPAECGTCGVEWPCEQAQQIEQREAEARGDRPTQVEQPDVPAEPGSPTAIAEQNERAKLLGGS